MNMDKEKLLAMHRDNPTVKSYLKEAHKQLLKALKISEKLSDWRAVFIYLDTSFKRLEIIMNSERPNQVDIAYLIRELEALRDQLLMVYRRTKDYDNEDVKHIIKLINLLPKIIRALFKADMAIY